MRRLLPLALLATATVAHAQAMKPGLWEITSRMSGGGMPAMPEIPADQRKQMEAMGIKMPTVSGGAMTISNRVCVTKEQADKRVPPQTEEDRRNRCEHKDVKTSGNTTSWRVECTGEQKLSGRGSMTFISPESYKGESTFTTEGQTMKQSYAGKWLKADCK